MSIYDELLAEIEIPRFYKLRQRVDRTKLSDVVGAVKSELQSSGVLKTIQPGMSVAVTAGSREIANIALILRTICDELKICGARPFIIPAMGSHGGAIAENQTALIAHFEITEEKMGVPIKSSMETVELGETSKGLKVYFDKYAAEADAIVPVGRIKIHTCFRGKIESGIMKMLAVGCGKQKGAAAMHRCGFPAMSQNVTETARLSIERLPVVFGFGIIENSRHETRSVHAMAAEEIEREEMRLLEEARREAVRIPFQKIDVLIVDEMGKNISGTGMDPNITGRSSPLGTFSPSPERVAVLDLTEASDGSAYGVGNADVITKRFFEKFIMDNTYPNGITNRDVKPMMLPPVMPSDRDAVRFALATLMNDGGAGGVRIVWLHNTLQMEEFYVSEALAREAACIAGIDIDWNEPFEMKFGRDGEIINGYRKIVQN